MKVPRIVVLPLLLAGLAGGCEVEGRESRGERDARAPVAGAATLDHAAARRAETEPVERRRLSVLMLGDEGHHRPAEMYEIIAPVLGERGINVTYTGDVRDLSPDTLGVYDVLLIFRDSGDLPPENEAALLAYVEGGGGLVAVHCASHCFRNSARYTALVGGRFARHGEREFRARIIDAQHAAMRGVASFESWDETYVHDQLSEDRRVLMVRRDDAGDEPYTWVRGQGEGRVYYTALGHDERTWEHSGFQRLIEQAVVWAAGEANDELPPLEYVEIEPGLPNYLPGERWGTEGERLRRMPLPLAPEDSIARMHLPEGFRVELFAAEPDIVNPMAMAFDERGRLWVIESLDYPNDLLDDPHEHGNDRITICEDTDGDGQADRFTVFADHLNIATGLVVVGGGGAARLFREAGLLERPDRAGAPPTPTLPHEGGGSRGVSHEGGGGGVRGAIVAVSPHIVLLEDSDGDDRADARHILYTGFGRDDTHAVHSNLHYGLDNWIWATVGYSGGLVRADDAQYSFRQGVFRFRADGSDFEFLAPTSNNTWGLGFNEAGDAFVSTANNEHSVHMAVPNRYYERVRGWYGQGIGPIADHNRIHPVSDDVRQMDWHGGFTAAAGHEVYTARSFPAEYWDRAAFVCEPTGNLIHLDWLAAQGSGYVAREGYNLMASTDPWTAPVAAQVGPDGAVWFLDWYSYVVQHNPTPRGFETGRGNAYVTPLRDREHGRVYRIVYEAAARREERGERSDYPSLTTADECIAALGHENLFWRLTAQRMLVERGSREVLPALAEIAGRGEGPSAVHALWAMRGIAEEAGLLEEAGFVRRLLAACRSALVSRDATVRRAALRVLPPAPDSAALILEADVLLDVDARVRLDALLALSETRGDGRVAGGIVAVLVDPENAQDRWIGDAATSAAAGCVQEFLVAASRFRPPGGGSDDAAVGNADSSRGGESERSRPAGGTYNVSGGGLDDTAGGWTSNALVAAVRVVAEHYARGGTDDSLAQVLAALAEAEPTVAAATLAGLLAGLPEEGTGVATPELGAALAALLESSEGEARVNVLLLANRLGAGEQFEALVGDLRATLADVFADEDAASEARLAAAEQLLSLMGHRRDAGATEDPDETIDAVLDAFTPRMPPELAAGLLQLLGEGEQAGVGEAIVERWGSFTPGVRQAALAVLLRRPEWTRALLDGLEEGTIALDSLSVGQQQQLARHSDAAIAARAAELLARGGRLPNPDRERVLQERLHLAEQTGDPAAGRAVFEEHCAACHRHGALGASIGPDLTGVAARPASDILTEILDPNRSVEGNFQQYTAVTLDGQTISGLLASETRTALELIDSEAERHVVLRDDIEELIATNLSLMPEGFERLSDEELANLLAFLSQRGRYVPLPLDRVATAVSTRGMFISREADVERLIFPDWAPKEFAGVPFHLVDPSRDRPNVILLYSPQGTFPPEMPRSVELPCGMPARAIHLLSGVSGWGYPYSREETVSMIVRLHYAGGAHEDHELLNGVHFADYIRRVDVPGSELAFMLRGQQMRYLAVRPEREETIERIEFVDGPDDTAPVVMAVTVEGMEE